MTGNPHRVAWSVLLGALAIFCALAVGIPAGILSFINNATVPPKLLIKLQAGRLVTFGPNESEARAPEVPVDGRVIEEGSTVVVDNDGRSLASLIVSDGNAELARLSLYSGTRLSITRARVPRYGSSTQPPEMQFFVLSGRAQVEDLDAREAVIRVNTAQLETTLKSGTYVIEVINEGDNAESSVTVRDGGASVALANPQRGQENVLALLANQRVSARKGTERLEVSPPSRNLVRNGNFAREIGTDWNLIRDRETDKDPLGKIGILDYGTERTVELQRAAPGIRWGRTGIVQAVNEDVKGRRALRLRLVFTILDQDVPVCGGQGSECPMIARILYRDQDGNEREWVQGFYAKGTASDDLPDYIRNFPLTERVRHVKKSLGTREQFESENLLAIVKDMQFIKTFSVYAEGHSVSAQVHTAELLLSD